MVLQVLGAGKLLESAHNLTRLLRSINHALQMSEIALRLLVLQLATERLLLADFEFDALRAPLRKNLDVLLGLIKAISLGILLGVDYVSGVLSRKPERLDLLLLPELVFF